MQVDSVSRLMQLNQLQSMLGSNSSSVSGSDSSSSFSALLSGMISNASSPASSTAVSTNSGTAVSGVDGISSATKSTGGLDLQPDKMLQMMQMLSSQSMLSSASSIGSTGDDSDSSDGSDDSDGSNDLAVTDNSANDMSQMIEQMLQSVMENQSSSDAAYQQNNNANTEVVSTKAM